MLQVIYFKNQLSNDAKITFQNVCNFCIISNFPANEISTLTGKVFPNPFREKLNLSSKLCNESDVTCALLSMDGRHVFFNTFRKSHFNNQPIQLDTRGVKPGVYLLKIIGRHKTETYKLIK